MAQPQQAPIIVGGSGPIIDKLEGTSNYNDWKFAMRMTLIMDGLWNCILGTDVDPGRDQRALAKICLSVKSSCYAHVREATTSKVAWDNLQNAFENKGLCRRLGLLRRLLRTKYEDFESMGDYVSGLVSLVQQLADIGHAVDDEEVAMLLLSGLPMEFDPLVMAIEATNTEISSEMIKARLLQEDYRRAEATSGKSNDAAFATKSSVKKTIICHHCNKAGHIKPRCLELRKKKKQDERTQKNVPKRDDENVLLTTALATTTFNNEDWFIDSGCTAHMSMRKDWFSKYSNDQTKKVTVANKQMLNSEGTGEVKVTLRNNGQRTITDVMYVPNIATNLLSVSKMTEKGLLVVFDDSKCRIYNKTECGVEGKCKVSATNIGGVYRLDKSTKSSSRTEVETTAVATEEPSATTMAAISQEIWHRRLGHLSQRSMVMLKKGLVSGINFQEEKETLNNCIPCIEGKQRRKSFPRGEAKRAKESWN